MKITKIEAGMLLFLSGNGRDSRITGDGSGCRSNGQKRICSGYKTCKMKCEYRIPHEVDDACGMGCIANGYLVECRHVFKKEEVMMRLTGKI